MQLIYYPYKCNTTDIQETPHITTADHLTTFTFRLLSFMMRTTRFVYFLTDAFVFGSLIVNEIAALKGNYFIPKCGCLYDCKKCRNSLKNKKQNKAKKTNQIWQVCALCERRLPDFKVVLDVIHRSIQFQPQFLCYG